MRKTFTTSTNTPELQCAHQIVQQDRYGRANMSFDSFHDPSVQAAVPVGIEEPLHRLHEGTLAPVQVSIPPQ